MQGPQRPRRARRWQRLFAVALHRSMRWSERRLPPGVRSVAGILLCIGGALGFLPVLGFWMLPLGLAMLAIDVPPLERLLRRWIQRVQRRR